MAMHLLTDCVVHTSVLFLTINALIVGASGSQQPHILLIVADDYGWNDVGYHNPEIYTPTIDKLAAAGVKLENYYVQPICTPSRSQLMSGKYQIHTGLQHNVVHPPQAGGLPLEEVTLADRLHALGYATHIVGKWHLGFFKKDYMPTHRGFDTHFGYLTGAEDYNTHVRCWSYSSGSACGTDLRDNEQIVWNNTQYSAHLFASRAQQVIRNHDRQKPMFLYLPFQSVHSPLEVPAEYEKRYSHIENKHRRIYSGMVSCMDEAIENVTQALKDAGLWDETLIIFSTDNGGINGGGGNNYPLRGEKHTLWEGGVRGVGFVHGNMIKQKGTLNRQLMHVSDWYPTLVSMAGGQINDSMKLDGYNVWDAISSGAPSPRKELLHNIDPLYPLSGNKSQYPDLFDIRVHAAIRVDNWKLLTGDPGVGNWVPPPNSTFPTIKARDKPTKNLWLFDLEKDPYEHNDVSADHPDVVKNLLSKLAAYNATAVPCRYPDDDPNSSPDLHGGAWGPWM